MYDYISISIPAMNIINRTVRVENVESDGPKNLIELHDKVASLIKEYVETGVTDGLGDEEDLFEYLRYMHFPCETVMTSIAIDIDLKISECRKMDNSLNSVEF